MYSLTDQTHPEYPVIMYTALHQRMENTAR